MKILLFDVRSGLHSMLQHNTMVYYTELYNTTLYYTILHYTTLHYTILHYTTYCIILNNNTVRTQAFPWKNLLSANKTHTGVIKWNTHQIGFSFKAPVESRDFTLLKTVPCKCRDAIFESCRLQSTSLVLADHVSRFDGCLTFVIQLWKSADIAL